MCVVGLHTWCSVFVAWIVLKVQQSEKLLDDEEPESAKPVTLYETVLLMISSPQMRFSIPIILYNGMRCAKCVFLVPLCFLDFFLCASVDRACVTFLGIYLTAWAFSSRICHRSTPIRITMNTTIQVSFPSTLLATLLRRSTRSTVCVRIRTCHARRHCMHAFTALVMEYSCRCKIAQ